MILMMTRALSNCHFQLLSIANTCGVDYLEPQESTPHDSHVKLVVEGKDINKKHFLEELRFRFGTKVWEVRDDT